MSQIPEWAKDPRNIEKLLDYLEQEEGDVYFEQLRPDGSVMRVVNADLLQSLLNSPWNFNKEWEACEQWHAEQRQAEVPS